MDVRTGTYLWNPPAWPPAPRLEGPLETEVAVVGAGVAGALVAHALATGGRRVAVIDREGPARGSTRASTALLQYDLDENLSSLQSRLGKESGRRVYRATFDAIRLLDEICGTLGPVGFARRPSLYLARTADEARVIEAEHDARREAGFSVVPLDSRAIRERYPWSGSAALLSRDAAVVDPCAFTGRLLEEVVRLGGAIYSGCDVARVSEDSSGVIAECKHGARVRCDRLVIAAGYETKCFLPGLPGKLTSTYAGATYPSQVPQWADDAVVWTAARPYEYFRRTEDGRVLFGGRDKPFRSPFLRDVLIPWERFRMGTRLREVLSAPNAWFECFWAGTFAESDDGLPAIGPVPGTRGIFGIFNTGGNGMVFSAVARELVMEWLDGRSGALAELLRIDRVLRKRP